VEADIDCCLTDLGDCYGVCENTFLSDVTPVEIAFINNVKSIYNSTYAVSGWDAVNSVCSHTSKIPDITHAERVRFRDSAAYHRDRRICRAECERDELKREDPADRKYKECGGDLRVCEAKCGGDMTYEYGQCINSYDICVAECDPSDLECKIACTTALRNCFKGILKDQIRCRMDCCKEEYEVVPNEHDRAECFWPCYQDRLDADFACRDEFDACSIMCVGDTGCIDGCKSTYCECKVAWKFDYDNCIVLCNSAHGIFGDCPNCFDDALEKTDGTTSVGGGYYTTGAEGGIPNPMPEPEATGLCPPPP
jgi:hypothetical protein